MTLPLAATLMISCSQQPAASPPAPPETPAAPTKPVVEIAGTPSDTVMTPEYVATVARFAYIWGWPLVNNLNRSLAVEKLPGPGRIGDVIPAAPPGSVSMLTDYISYKEQFVTCPNQDTVYGAGYQHVDSQPVVIQVPDFGDRFFTYQIADARTDSFGGIGKRSWDKTGFLFTRGPNLDRQGTRWHYGRHSLTDRPCRHLSARFSDDTAEDRAAIQPLLNQVMVYPLKDFDGKMKTTRLEEHTGVSRAPLDGR